MGSGGRCELQIKDKGIAPRHAALTLQGGVWILKDLKSKTGTIVNNQQAAEVALGNGDVVGLGGAASFRFNLTPTELAAAAMQQPIPQQPVQQEHQSGLPEK